MKKFLIVGANFINKGAQSMLFITMDEIYKRFPDAEIFFGTFEYIDESKYRFKTVFYNPLAVSIALDPSSLKSVLSKTRIKNTAKRLTGKGAYTVPVNRLNELTDLIGDIEFIIDISGFGLGSKWGVIGSKIYLNNIRLARKYNKPIVLMPQSFGPFDYAEEKEKLISEIKDVLAYPVKIFAREEQGYKLLTDMGLTNVEKAYDLVLQNKGIDVNNIFMDPYENAPIQLETNDNVAVIPNVQCFRHGDKETNIALYKKIIEDLIGGGRNVYIVSHATEDKEICGLLKGQFADESAVKLFDKDLSCLEYDKFVKQFDYIVCSRFHGIVHAYRNAVPCIILGWAVKYIELAKTLGQDEYCFDITAADNSLSERLSAAVSQMDKNYSSESETISGKLIDIQRNNCFDSIEMK